MINQDGRQRLHFGEGDQLHVKRLAPVKPLPKSKSAVDSRR